MWVVFSRCEILADWKGGFILNLYKGEGEAFDRGSYCGLELTDQVMKLLEWVLDFYICETVNIDEKQFSCVPDRCVTEEIFIVPQLQEKYFATNKTPLLCPHRP